MESVVLEFGLCLIESIIIFVFFNALLKKKFQSVFPTILVILIYTVIMYFCSEINMIFKSLISTCSICIGSSILYKDKPAIKITYSFLSLYILYIVDIIFGNILSLLTDNSIVDLLFISLINRMVFSLIIKLIDALSYISIYKMVSQIEKTLKNKYWILFCGIIFVFYVISLTFLQVYPSIELNNSEMFMYTLISSLFFAMSLIVIYFFSEISKGFQRDSKLFILENNYINLQEQIEFQRQNDERSRKLRHDMLNHLTNVRTLIEGGETASAVQLLERTSEKIIHTLPDRVINTGNKIVDAILLSKMAVCHSKDISFDYSIEPLDNLDIDVIDLSSLISNLLDNAIEAAVQTVKPFVKINIFKYNVYCTICIENSYNGEETIKQSEERLFSTKANNAFHGYGTQIINDIAQKYDGNFSWEMEDNRFIATVLLKI